MVDSALFTKILVIGNSTAGKSAFLKRLCFGTFEENTNPTIGCDFCIKTCMDAGKKTISLQLWEIAGSMFESNFLSFEGHDRYAAASKLYLRGAYGCLIIVDATEPNGLESALKWRSIIMDGNDPFENVNIPMIILQNKIDLLDKDRLQEYQTKKALDDFVEKNNFKAGFQVSAKNKINVEEAIDYLVKEVLSLKKNRNMNNFRTNEDSLIKLSRHSVDTTARRSLMRKSQDKCSC